MNQLGITCFVLVVINTQARPGAEKNDLSVQGTADKRWIQSGTSFGVIYEILNIEEVID